MMSDCTLLVGWVFVFKLNKVKAESHLRLLLETTKVKKGKFIRKQGDESDCRHKYRSIYIMLKIHTLGNCPRSACP